VISDLPSPEERILESIHASQRKVEQPILGILVPILPSVPECTVWVRGRIGLDALQVEATIIDAITVFSGNSNTEGGLAGKKPVSPFGKENKIRMMAYLVVWVLFHDEQAIAGQTPPI
jgi:hypothetical protein